jgi:hypothetical protein
MKKLLLVALVLFVTNVKGQVKFNKSQIIQTTISDSGAWLCRVLKDTLLIPVTNEIKFIKIGDRVYKIESPTLTEVPKPLVLYGSWLNERLILPKNNYYLNSDTIHGLFNYTKP